ncbi:MAG: S-methyl-5'-thioadenosine phosphorylase [Chloroflexi bacterium]|nr:S-methyl-5'-thioadenosine phosphorylase [Chloroflexota bacterium]
MSDGAIGIIGGSGLYDIEGLTDIEEVSIETPFGDPSDKFTVGIFGGRRLAFLPRHGRGHRISPTDLNSRANIYGFKLLGVEQIISVSAVGSMREDIEPLDIVVPDQILDRTKARPSTFFSEGLVVHVGFADPFCPIASGVLYEAAKLAGARVHKGGTYVCIEGPQFSTRAESRVYRQWGVDVIGMTALPEAKLAREAEICYVTLALATDYDVWHQTEEPVTVEMIVANLLRNVEMAKAIIKRAVPLMPQARECACASALESAIITQRNLIPQRTRQRVSALIKKYTGDDA